jgi:ABC-type multidrug transport system, ATPase component
MFGLADDPSNIDTRRREGYMSHVLSLYSELIVQQDLELYAQLYHILETYIACRVQEMSERYSLSDVENTLPCTSSVRILQRLWMRRWISSAGNAQS